MKITQITSTLLRFPLAVVWMLTSLYALLAYVPFTYRQVLSINLIPGVQTFASLQPMLLAIATVFFAAFIFLVEKRKTISLEDRRELIILTILSLGLAAWNLPKHLTNDSHALIWSFVCLVPPLWLSFFSFRDLPESVAETLPPLPIILAGGAAGLFSALVSGLSYATLDGTSVLTVTILMVAAGSLLAVVDQFNKSARFSLTGSLHIYTLVLTVFFGSFLWDQVCAAIAFFGPLSWAWSFAFAFTFIFLLVSSGVRITAVTRRGLVPSLLWPIAGLFPLGAELILLPALAMAFHFVHQQATVMDWNGLAQKGAALFLLLLSFVILLRPVETITAWIETRTSEKTRVLNTAVLLFLVLTGGIYLRSLYLPIQADPRMDPAFVLAKNLVFPKAQDSTIFPFLQAHTNLAKTIQVQLKEIELKPVAGAKPETRPFIFIFVVDSLRRDYVAAYNPAATFTSAMGEFAKDALVVKNAFTRYGATGLSEPSIWAGRMFPHQMYPQPFEKINLLHKLVQKEEYNIWLSRDSILKEILVSGPNEHDLDAGVGTQDLDLCKTTAEITERLKTDSSKPAFVYSQPQNIHVSVLARSQEETNPEASEFFAPYVNALRKVDTCFGTFIAELKTLGVYDKSLIVLTSDHGDSLGEEGRYGHAYTVYPEIVRIPLLIHVPKDLLKDRLLREDIAFSTDIAPTIASLLGYEVSSKNWWEGRSLFAPAVASSGPHLVMSSYGPVAGLISETGDSMSIADAINFTVSRYQIDEKGSKNLGADSASRIETETLIKEKFEEFYEAYGL